MNSIINNSFRTIGIAFAALLLAAVSFAVAPHARAADLFDDFGYGDYYTDTTDFGYGDYYTDTTDYGYGDYYTDTTDYGYGDYYQDTTYSDYVYSDGYRYTGGSTLGGSSYRTAPGYTYQPQYQYQQQRTTPSNTSTCTAVNSCNSYWDDHSIFNAPTNIVTDSHNIVTNPAPQTVVYAQPTSYPVYTQPAPVYTPPVYTPSYYPAQQRPVAYNNTPYVTLAAVPYTGLELGPVGTALYWGFLVLWCLLAAYLIVVKKIQNKIAAWFTGGSAAKQAPFGHANFSAEKSAEMLAPSRSQLPPAAVLPALAGIDPFILGQISRAK